MRAMARGFASYSPLPDTIPGPGAADLRPELADVGRLVRRGLRTMIGALDTRNAMTRTLLGSTGTT